jgi:hypothetical protein
MSKYRTSSVILLHILTRPALFPIEHRGTEGVCYYAIKSLFDVLYLDMWRNHFIRDVTTKMWRAENKYGNKSGAV